MPSRELAAQMGYAAQPDTTVTALMATGCAAGLAVHALAPNAHMNISSGRYASEHPEERDLVWVVNPVYDSCRG
ncbi:unnamed protein product [Rhizoctonia solani]|uniref:Uncharacterized protein n=1 Tax=Rhizoctonia solani TaxID=456999 RepID=A0A8H3HEP7_9AGAM|nr:unnamed protein product [Rhizoctonia solani]